jgi:poly(A) polymerase
MEPETYAEQAVRMRAAAESIVRRLQDAGFSAYWVGGCVRDFLLGRVPEDFDIVTSALPDQIEAIFARTIPVGRKFGVLIVLEDGFQFQVATFRAESDYRDGRHPEHVAFGDARADAERRDFTINGLLYDPLRRETRDWVGGEADLRAGIIRAIGSPEARFGEDHLRILRAVRFAAQLGFQFEERTWDAIKALAPKVLHISAERIRDELLKIFRFPHAARGLELLQTCGLLAQILPELEATTTCEQSQDFHPEGTVFNHLVLMLRQLPPDAPPALAWAVLLHDVAKPLTAAPDPATGSIHFYGHERVGAEMAEAILTRLRFPRAFIDEIVHAVRCHMQFKDAPKMRTATLRRMILRPTFPLELQLHRLDCLGSHGRLEVYDFLVQQTEEMARKPTIRPPLLNGDDLIALGVAPGPAMGKLLSDLRDKQLQEELVTSDEARAWVLAQIGRPGAHTDGSQGSEGRI